jgi:hypothetical protein
MFEIWDLFVVDRAIAGREPRPLKNQFGALS